jgi:hypothetical protein
MGRVSRSQGLGARQSQEDFLVKQINTEDDHDDI